MASPERGKYNGNFFLPILDLVMLILLFTGAAYYHYTTRGVVTISESEQKRQETLASYEEEIEGYRQQIVEARAKREQAMQDREMLKVQAETIDNQIKVEHERIQEYKKRDADLTTEFVDLRLPFRERGRVSDDYIRAIKAAWSGDVPEYKGAYVSFGGATFSPRPVQRPHPPIWVGGAPGAVSAPAVRRCAELGDAWHPLGLSLDDIEKGYATLRDLAARRGRREPLGLAPRNLLDLTDAPKGSGRAPFQGAVAEVASDIRRVRALGAGWMTFDLPRAGVPAMARAMERLAREVKTTAA